MEDQSLDIHRCKTFERCLGVFDVFFRMKVIVLSTEGYNVRITGRRCSITEAVDEPIVRIADACE